MSSSEVAARGMDLTRAAFEIVNKTGVAGALAGKVMKWLAREGIDESEFENCLGTLKQVVFPNDFGLEIRRNLERGDTRVKAQPYVGILNIVRGGSIGRWMTDDLKYCWLVTTVVALSRTHLNIGYIADAVCDMVLDGGDHADGVKYKYRYEKTRMLPVVTKIVDSILLNIVNCGTTLEMPEELRDVDRHVVNHETFAAVTMTVYRAEGNVIVRSKKFPIDVYLWLCAHVEGTISTSIYGKIIHRLKIGSSQKTIDFVVDEIGQGEGFTFGSKEAVAINISGAKLETLLRHTSPDYERSSPNIRQPLYNFCLRNQLKRQDLLEIKMVGQRIVKWIMDHPITSIHESEWIEYKTHRPRDNGSMSLTIGRLLKRWPSICNIDYDTSMLSIGFNNPRPRDGRSDFDEDLDSMADCEILECFPQVRDVLDRAMKWCNCPFCRERVEDEPQRELHGGLGCLGYEVQDQLWFIIAHAIADGFGAPDVSILGDSDIIRESVRKLMSELIARKMVAWETWFALAACVYLGCPRPAVDGFEAPGTGELVAVQHGCAVAIASWVDLRADVKVQGSFGFTVAEVQIRGMEGNNYGTLFTERTSPPAQEDVDLRDPAGLQDDHVDDAEFVVQSGVIGVAGSPYRLMVIVKAGNYLRIINPCAAVMALTRSVKSPPCIHRQGGELIPLPSPTYRTWPTDKALGLWNGDNLAYNSESFNAESGSTQHSPSHWGYRIYIPDTAVNRNILLALSPWGCVIKNEQCCLACAEALAHESPRQASGRRVLCVTADETALLHAKRRRMN